MGDYPFTNDSRFSLNTNFLHTPDRANPVDEFMESEDIRYYKVFVNNHACITLLVTEVQLKSIAFDLNSLIFIFKLTF